MYAVQRQVFLTKNLLLCGTTDILVGNDTLRINLYAAMKRVSPLPSLLKRGGADARSVQKTPTGVLVVRRGLFFVKRQRRCAAYFQKIILETESCAELYPDSGQCCKCTSKILRRNRCSKVKRENP